MDLRKIAKGHSVKFNTYDKFIGMLDNTVIYTNLICCFPTYW
jgi:hypothetical protein